MKVSLTNNKVVQSLTGIATGLIFLVVVLIILSFLDSLISTNILTSILAYVMYLTFPLILYFIIRKRFPYISRIMIWSYYVFLTILLILFGNIYRKLII